MNNEGALLLFLDLEGSSFLLSVPSSFFNQLSLGNKIEIELVGAGSFEKKWSEEEEAIKEEANEVTVTDERNQLER